MTPNLRLEQQDDGISCRLLVPDPVSRRFLSSPCTARKQGDVNGIGKQARPLWFYTRWTADKQESLAPPASSGRGGSRCSVLPRSTEIPPSSAMVMVGSWGIHEAVVMTSMTADPNCLSCVQLLGGRRGVSA